MQIKNTAIIFDVDKTLIRRDLHEIIIDDWKVKTPWNMWIYQAINLLKRAMVLNFLKRRFEYFLLLFIHKDHVTQSVINIFDSKEHLNLGLLKRLMKYKRSNCQIILVTASPYEVVRPLASYLEVDSYHSTMLAGVLVRDLLGKKIKIYRRLERKKIALGAIYSDSPLDFFSNARKNILITDSKSSVIKK